MRDSYPMEEAAWYWKAEGISNIVEVHYNMDNGGWCASSWVWDDNQMKWRCISEQRFEDATDARELLGEVEVENEPSDKSDIIMISYAALKEIGIFGGKNRDIDLTS